MGVPNPSGLRSGPGGWDEEVAQGQGSGLSSRDLEPNVVMVGPGVGGWGLGLGKASSASAGGILEGTGVLRYGREVRLREGGGGPGPTKARTGSKPRLLILQE